MQGLMLEAWPPARRRTAIGNLADIAESERKDAVAATQLLLAYTYGKPIDRKEISGPDGGPIALDAAVLTGSAEELAAWRKQQIDVLSSGPIALAMQVISSTTTDS